MNINQVWPEWNEDCILGEGSFGKVYRAKRVEYGRTFYSAIKVLQVPKDQQEVKFARSQGMNDQDIYNYFQGLVDNLLNEITLMDNLKGAKNIVGIEDYKIIEREGEFGWEIFIRMELLTPFDSFISNPDFSQQDVIKLGVDLCSALEVCEQNQIVHRDIKPDNIFISRFGEYKLGDFGIARKLEATQANLSRKGTLNYMAPEVYKSEPYGSNVDIYSLGLVLYTLLNNNRVAFLPPYPQPITYKDNEEALAKRLSGKSLIPPCNASYSLGAVITKACAFNPYERYQSATEFKNALIAEWNMLVQSGNNYQIMTTDFANYDNYMDLKLQNTTNDMSSNSRVVADVYNSNSAYYNQSESISGNYLTGDDDTSANIMNVKIPESYAEFRASKVCRVLTWPLSIASMVLFAVMSFVNGVYESVMPGVSMLVLGLIFFIADRNKKAVGLAAFAAALPCIGAFFTGGLIVFESVIMAVFALLMTISGALIFFQKNVRLGGTICLPAFLIELIFFIVILSTGEYYYCCYSEGHLFCAISALLIFVWSYGYKAEELTGVKKFLNIVAYVVVAAGIAANIGIMIYNWY